MASTNKTTNLKLNSWIGSDTSQREDFNNDNELIDNWAGEVNEKLSNMVFQTAGGTGTEITLNIKGTLVNGYPMTFIASANNGGAATTVNGKPLYKPNTTTPPNITSGKAYTIWYNAPGDYFFLKASAEGNATENTVLAGYTFSNDNDTGLVGTMPNNGAISGTLNAGGSKVIPAGYTSGGTITANSLASQTSATATASQILSGKTAWVNGAKITGNIASLGETTYTPKTTNQTIAAGKYLSGTQTIKGDANLVAKNIIKGKSIFGVSGSATVASLGGKGFATGDLGKITLAGWVGTSANHSFSKHEIKLSFNPSVFFWIFNDKLYYSTDYGSDNYVTKTTNYMRGIHHTWADNTLTWENDHSSSWTISGTWIAYE